MTAAEITVRKLRHHQNLNGSSFLSLYEKLVMSQSLTPDEYQELLSFAVIFMRQGDATVEKLGYRIALQYSLDTLDFDPLLAISDQREIMPVVDAVRRSYPASIGENLRYVLSEAHQVNFTKGDITRTREQLALQQFNNQHAQAVIIAPTSYGKSEMLIARAVAALPGAVCIVVPSKALIAQTKAELMRVAGGPTFTTRVITHPEAYNGEASFVAVLTQERLHRLFVDNPDLRLGHLLVDEAQNVLANDSRSLELSEVILIARYRNPDLQIAYYTPFLEEPEAIRHVNGADEAVQSRTVHEQVKSERFFAGEAGDSLHVYDQFLGRGFATGTSIPSDEADAVLALGGERTIVYLNKPRDAQGLALRLADRLGPIEISPSAETAIAAIGDLIDKDYMLVDAIRSGVLFHHGQIPEVLRQYVEKLFREDHAEQRRYLVTTSTLLEGVNTPADTMILMSAGKGRANLVRSSFRNLVGRVARFSQIFAPERPRLSLLLPKIYAIKSTYSRADWNPLKWLGDHADPSKPAIDPIENPLLEGGPKDQPRIEALERLENIQRGASGLEEVRLALTQVGQLCFRHGAHDFDVFRYELLMQSRVESRTGTLAATADDLLLLIRTIFLDGVDLWGKDTADLERLRDESAAQRFYAMFLSWRADGAPMKLMIGRYLKYWQDQDSDWIWVGSKWGDEKRSPAEHRKAYVRRSRKNRPALVNLAIVRIKAELDFLDYHLAKYLEILFALGLVEENFYLKVKYGTEDRLVITMLRNGMSFELAKLIAESYSKHVLVDTEANTAEVTSELLAALEADAVNDILLFEVRGLLGA
ncbi:DEAD/DEAH box helicase [Paramicrobacterium agarici]|uniref:DEAD/DEAH box helicase n=1 Tax=Paramicrobacterium agarici TaxID=630514 RepID=UPI00114FD6EC|nr:DEAD/DEAH box helicase [Microbacterium agarici]TQO21459.1 hypothetical protein FB385_0261 [Microbacterium agarici]